MKKKTIVVGALVGLAVVIALGVVAVILSVKYLRPIADWWRADTFAGDVFVYSNIHGEFPADVRMFCIEAERARHPGDCDKYSQNYHDYVMRNFLIHAVTIEEVKQGSGYVSAKCQGDERMERMAKIANEKLHDLFYAQACGAETFINGVRWDGTWYLGDKNHEE